MRRSVPMTRAVAALTAILLQSCAAARPPQSVSTKAANAGALETGDVVVMESKVRSGTSTRPPLTLTYLGAAGYQIEANGVRILADPYFSRPATLEGKISPDMQAIGAHAPDRANMIVVGHSHLDHLLDVPAIALATGAQVLGTASTARVALASGVPQDHVIMVRGGEDFAMDRYSIRVIPSLHSALNDKHEISGDIAAGISVPMSFSDYQEGGTLAYLIRLAGHEVLFLSTANFIESELSGIRPDIAIVATGLREEIYDYTCRLMRSLGQPAFVYLNHFDGWRDPPSDGPPSADALAFVDEVRACCPNTQVVIPHPFEPMIVP